MPSMHSPGTRSHPVPPGPTCTAELGCRFSGAQPYHRYSSQAALCSCLRDHWYRQGPTLRGCACDAVESPRTRAGLCHSGNILIRVRRAHLDAAADRFRCDHASRLDLSIQPGLHGFRAVETSSRYVCYLRTENWQRHGERRAEIGEGKQTSKQTGVHIHACIRHIHTQCEQNLHTHKASVQTETDRPTDRPTDGPTDRPTERPTETDRDRQRLADRQTDRPTDRQTEQTDRQNRPTD